MVVEVDDGNHSDMKKTDQDIMTDATISASSNNNNNKDEKIDEEPKPASEDDEKDDAVMKDNDDDTDEKTSKEEDSNNKKEDTINDGKSPEENAAEEKKKDEAEKQRIEELKKKYANWPLRDIKEPHENDVMYGRGGGTNHHPGNKRYRKMVEDRKLEYVNSKRLDKPLVALEIIRIWRGQLPPGRFLKLDEKTGLWHDVGDKKAREKTSQALREKAPLLRKQQEEENDEDDDNSEEEDGKTTRFAEGTKGEASTDKVKKAILARDHSLGREYLETGEAVSLEGFSWQDPFKAGKQVTSLPAKIHPPPQTLGQAVPGHVPAGRNSSSGSLGMAPPFHQTSMGGPPPPPPPPPDYYGRIGSGGQRREFSNSSLGSWGYPYPPPPIGVAGMHQRSGSWTHPIPPSVPHHGSHHQRSGSWGTGREHSLSFNPLIGASVSRPADQGAFGSGYWGEQISPTAAVAIIPPPPPPPGAYGGLPYLSGGSTGGAVPPGPYRNPSPSNSATPSPPYNVDMSIARSWSGGDVQPNWSNEPPPGPPSYDGPPRPVPSGDHNPQQSQQQQLLYAYNGPEQNGLIPRPTMVKRDTSNQNETYETKPSIKRAALNRDQSATSNRLKQEFMPDYFNREMETLQETTEQIRLSPGPEMRDQPRPKPLGDSGRVTTMDAIADELMARPAPLLADSRVSTIDALDLDLDASDSVLNADDFDKLKGERRNSVPRPAALGPDNRLTTQEFLDIVTSPIGVDDDKSGDDDDEDPLPFER
ncbi:hypothetical protein IV203_009662 [Nitzschia inconspicua]|uniref:DUF6824 domain-containing protein n=1 Tax=Nitzschia inconspicua TaxID=303405 RepID=A0A9K3KVB9_9STRA|nr:hypothetical protein IV203_009662 [Nitzschia inconspicua]